MKKKIFIPADVPKSAQLIYLQNYNNITHNGSGLMMFSADQKIEHLNQDFYDPLMDPCINNPDHIFNIASRGKIGALATQLGLISRYGKNFPDINYIIKLNSKTNLITIEQKDPLSRALWNVDDVIKFKEISELKIAGIGYTIYIGSEFEDIMLHEAAQMIKKAHEHGLIAILWIYPRGKALKNKNDLDLIPGAAGIANALGADFAKISVSENNEQSNDLLKIATQAAGNTKIICSGGASKQTEYFLKQLHDQIIRGGTFGNATGRNIFRRRLDDAIAFTNAISSIVYDKKSAQEAYEIYKKLLTSYC